ncbi:lasso peptide biosynthesis B2 protein [Streptomyces nigrescens]|uniref:lasso peptide biosynthesis B2 protein n=1 Tax=Streptomyces nigrescens TaxID=1920 RepID=UPI003485A3E4
MEAYSTVRTGTYPERLAAAAGLTLALVLLRLPFRHTVHATRLATQAGRRPLDPARAEALVGAVRHTARWWPGRVACMETSLGTVLAAALLGRRLTWCIGARFSPPPVEYHAWAELPDHGPVAEYTVAGWHYLTGMTIPGRRARIHQPPQAVVAYECPTPRRSEQ